MARSAPSPKVRKRRLSFLLMGILLGLGITLALVFFTLAGPAPRTLVLPAFFLLFLAFSFLILYQFSRNKAVKNDHRELERQLSLLVQHIKDYAIFFIDPEGRVMSWNKGAQQIKGYTEAEIIGKSISIFYTDEDNQSGEPFLNLKRALNEGRYESVGLRKRKDGSVFYADVVFTPIYDDRNHLKGFAKITRDITQQKKAEDDMLTTLRREQELGEMKSRFVTLASHEFKTPLSVILSSASLIERYPETVMQDKRIRHIERIRSNVNNLKQILNDFLSLEKLEMGIVSNNPVDTDLVRLMQDTIQDMEEAKKEGQSVHLHIAGAPRLIRVDTHLLQNVLINLLSNAIKYSPGHTPIDYTVIYLPLSVEIRCRDRGIGISADDQKRLFERFFRASNTAGISGTGLGLSIVKRHLDLMGGQISLSSAPGDGSVFTVTLPAGSQEEEEEEEEEDDAPL